MASVACRHVREHPDSERFSAFPRIHSFSVGLKDSPDLKVRHKHSRLSPPEDLIEYDIRSTGFESAVIAVCSRAFAAGKEFKTRI